MATYSAQPREDAMRSFLEQAKLPEYFDLLIHEGADDVQQLCDAAKDELTEVFDAVKMKPMHRRRFKKALETWKSHLSEIALVHPVEKRPCKCPDDEEMLVKRSKRQKVQHPASDGVSPGEPSKVAPYTEDMHDQEKDNQEAQSVRTKHRVVEKHKLSETQVKTQESGTSYDPRTEELTEEKNFPDCMCDDGPDEEIYKTSILDKCTVIPEEDPESLLKHKLPLKEYLVDRRQKTRWCTTIPEPDLAPEKRPRTLVMLGATGAGKSTLIDALVNYVLGVTWEDLFRFTLIDMKDDEKRNKGKAVSQTQWITTYVIHPYPGSRVDYELRIVDMPGFGDTGGLTKDRQLVDRLRNFFSMSPQHGGLAEVDQVCFVVQAALPRLTAEQKYILYSIEALFDKSIKDNISAFITFADGKRPPVLAALKEADACVNEKHFVFNNSALFAVNESKSSYAGMAISKMFWDIGQDSCASVFAALVLMETKSLQLAKDVLDKRNQIEITVQKLRREVTKGIGNLDTLVQERQMLDRHAADVKGNKNFKYTVDETKYDRIKIRDGTYVTNCLMCNETCHYPCGIPNDSDKRGCWAMHNGKCTVCKNKCAWQEHRNDGHKYELVVHKIERTYDVMKQKYEAALQGSSEMEDVVAALCTDFMKTQTEIHDMGKHITELTNWLQKNALSQRPQSKLIDYYETMIQAEKRGKKPGYGKRVRLLQDAKENCKMIQDLKTATFNPWQQYMDRPELLHASALTKTKSKSAMAKVSSGLREGARYFGNALGYGKSN